MQFSGQPCSPQPFFEAMEIPNCDDPVFLAYCAACGITPGTMINARDARIARLEAMMHGRDPTYDPESDRDDDYLTPRGF